MLLWLLLLPLAAASDVDHAVPLRDALRAARDLPRPPERPLGCGKCSDTDELYCSGYAVLHDHCCCDLHYYAEAFPFVEHVCYRSAARCRPVAANCAEYTRVRDCCCAQMLAEKWKAIANSGPVLNLDVALLAVCCMSCLLRRL